MDDRKTPPVKTAPLGVVPPSGMTLSGWMLSDVTRDSVRVTFNPLTGPITATSIDASALLTRRMLEEMLSRMDRAAPPLGRG